jgi:phenylacetic acid degradation operon negative regulatory protein
MANLQVALAHPRRSRGSRGSRGRSAFLIRTLLIHDYRRLLLRDPELPAEWPGQKARLLCNELYRSLAPASERRLDRCLVLADGTIPPADPAFADRFPQDDPLAAMSL